MQQKSTAAALCLILAMLLWASSFVALKIAFLSYHPMQVIFGRMLVASLCFLPFVPSFFRIKWHLRDLRYLLLMALFEPCLYFLFEAEALQNTSASQAGMITAMLPLLVAVAAWLLLKEKISHLTLVGFFIAICGAIILSLAAVATTHSPAPLLGNLCELAAMVCAAGYTICLKHLSGRYSPLFLTAVQAMIGCIFFAFFLLPPDVGLPTHWEFGPGLAIIYLGTFITFGAYGLFNFGVSRIPANQAAAFVNLIPVFSVMLGSLVLSEHLTKGQWLAVLLVFIGVFISRQGGHRLNT
ncbi:DMT family transporter [Geopsychrobacter electrodiphilus]|uniref:DMT family transporter n=1 Tax=Geopsychrobacter electrodiphilus TaxID=225196 RepID=UPI0003AA1731|nr:DMT family transporter [Geopsychrobacter electrodiphilus]